MKPEIIRAGDWVQVLVAKQFVRCGYPKMPADFTPQAQEAIALIENTYLPKTKTYNIVGKEIEVPRRFSPRLADKLRRDIAWALCVMDGFGGRERTIHTQENPKLLGRKFLVDAVSSVVTGVYYPPSGGYSSYNGDYDYEPGGLDHTKVHRIAFLVCDDLAAAVEVVHLKKIPSEQRLKWG